MSWFCSFLTAISALITISYDKETAKRKIAEPDAHLSSAKFYGCAFFQRPNCKPLKYLFICPPGLPIYGYEERLS
jgi:hypothetical protein